MTHYLGCAGPRVRVVHGVTKDLAHCDSCGAETWVNER